eukprot:6684597-Prymnesium_polylepis.1
MAILFPAALGAMYAHFFTTAIATKDFELRTRQDVALAVGVYNKLVVTMFGPRPRPAQHDSAEWAQWAKALQLARREVQSVGHQCGGAEAPRHRRPRA